MELLLKYHFIFSIHVRITILILLLHISFLLYWNMLYKINQIKSEMTFVKVTSTKVIWRAKIMAYLGLLVFISTVREVWDEWWWKMLVKRKKWHVWYKSYLQGENERKHNLYNKTNESWKKNSFNNRPSTDNPDLDQVIFISSQPVSNQTWRFTVAPIDLLVNCHSLTVFDPLC